MGKIIPFVLFASNICYCMCFHCLVNLPLLWKVFHWVSNLLHYQTLGRVVFSKILLIVTERGREGEREGEKRLRVRETAIGCLSRAPNTGPGPQPRPVPWPGIQPATLHFSGQRPAHWATPVTPDRVFRVIRMCDLQSIPKTWNVMHYVKKMSVRRIIK